MRRLLPLLLALSALMMPARAEFDPMPQAGEMMPPFHSVLLRGFEEPLSPYGAGHRGIDLSAVPGTSIAAGLEGEVTFAGQIAGDGFVTIETPDPYRLTYSYLGSILVAQGQWVAPGDIIGTTGPGHSDRAEEGLHLGLRVRDSEAVGGWRYIDPMPMLRNYRRRVRIPVVNLIR
jgi:murein DD-endopeptidase MepM/ murein hydrolase activator NlpD